MGGFIDLSSPDPSVRHYAGAIGPLPVAAPPKIVDFGHLTAAECKQ